MKRYGGWDMIASRRQGGRYLPGA